MNEAQFLSDFEAARLKEFPHRDHIHMAWLYLRRDGWDAGYKQIQGGLKNFATTLGFATKYHETITRFWALLVMHCIQESPAIDSYEKFIEAYPILLDKTAMTRHYSPEILKRAHSRNHWVEPDLIPMPTLDTSS